MGKRARVGTPSKGSTGKVSALLEGWGTVTAGQITKLATLSRSLQGTPKAADIAGVLRETLTSFTTFLQDQSTIVSDLMSEFVLLEERTNELEARQDAENRPLNIVLDLVRYVIWQHKLIKKVPNFNLFETELQYVYIRLNNWCIKKF
jgi:hypothetical protein